jgi:hypothetical protein
MSITFYPENSANDQSLPTFEVCSFTASILFTSIHQLSTYAGRWSLPELEHSVQPAIFRAIDNAKALDEFSLREFKTEYLIVKDDPESRLSLKLEQLSVIVRNAISQKNGIYWDNHFDRHI